MCLSNNRQMIISEHKIPVKTNLLFTIFIALWGTIALLIMVTISSGIIICLCNYELFSAVLFILIAVILSYNLVVWRIAGAEIIQIHDDGILLTRSRTIFRKKRFISFNEFESVVVNNDKDTPRWIKLYSIGGGKIKIKYLGRNTRVGMSIHIQDAESIVNEINNTISQIRD